MTTPDAREAHERLDHKHECIVHTHQGTTHHHCLTPAGPAADLPREERGEGLLDIIRDLMESMDWVGTGSQKSGDMERAEYEARIAAATPAPDTGAGREKAEGAFMAFMGGVLTDFDAATRKRLLDRAEYYMARLTADTGAEERLRAALERYGEHQHEWGPTPTKRYENGAWRDAVEPEEGWDRTGVKRICPDEETGECWCGLLAVLHDSASSGTSR